MKFELSEREAQVYPLLLKGLTSNQIADELGILSSNVRNYSLNIYAKKGVGNQKELLVQRIEELEAIKSPAK